MEKYLNFDALEFQIYTNFPLTQKLQNFCLLPECNVKKKKLSHPLLLKSFKKEKKTRYKRHNGEIQKIQ